MYFFTAMNNMNDSNNNQSNIVVSNSNVSDDDYSIENDDPIDKIDPITVLQDNIGPSVRF
jgi:hypothetical protein